jgi:glucose-1-phosphate cytidylyltransferase
MKPDNKKIPVIILAGGDGIAFGERNSIVPKTIVEINGRPLLAYIVDHYAQYGFSEFFVCAGKGKEMIEAYSGKNLIGKGKSVHVLDTGEENNTGSRVAQACKLVKGAERVALTYGDIYSDVELDLLQSAHIQSGRTATLLAVHRPTRFRILGLVENDTTVRGFANKPVRERDYINGGFYFLNKGIFSLPALSEDPGCVFEKEVLDALILEKELNAYKYLGFWYPLDSARDRRIISEHLKGDGK